MKTHTICLSCLTDKFYLTTQTPEFSLTFAFSVTSLTTLNYQVIPESGNRVPLSWSHCECIFSDTLYLRVYTLYFDLYSVQLHLLLDAVVNTVQMRV